MIEHKPWLGPQYELGIDGQRVALVGYSHHRDPEHEDGPHFTTSVIQRWMTEPFKNSLFRHLESYFSYGPDLWNRVLFFNYLPDCVGTSDERYRAGTEAQLDRARARYLRIIGDMRPHKVLIFTTKGWREMPPTREEEEPKGKCKPLGNGFEWGTYDARGHIVGAFGLRHPQFAEREIMKRVVRRILTMPLGSLR